MLPQRRALTRSATREEQSASGTLAEASRKQRRLWQRRNDDVVHFGRIEDDVVDRQLLHRLGKSNDDAVVAPHRVDGNLESRTQAMLDRHRPRGVHRSTERAVNAHSPIAEVVTEPFDDDRAITRHRTRRFGLLCEILHDVACGEIVESMSSDQLVVRAHSVAFTNGANEFAECAAELERSAGAVTVPERHLSLLARRGAHCHAIEGDVLDSPRARTENERLARSRFVHHLFVEFPDARAIGQEHAEQSPVGNRSAVRHRESLCSFACTQRVFDAVPHESRFQLCELLARIATAQEIEHVGQDVIGEVGEVRAATNDRSERSAGDLRIHRHVGDDLLGEHVQWIAQEPSGLDLPRHHPFGNDFGFEQVVAMLGEHLADARLADLVARTTDALHATTHRARRFNLNHEIDGTHVNAEFQTARGDQCTQFPALQLVLDDHALFPSERSVVRFDQFVHTAAANAALDGELIDVGGQTFGLTPRIAEDDGALVFEDEVQDLRIHARPDARATLRECRGCWTASQLRRRLAEIAHVLDGDDHLYVEFLAHAGIDDRDRTRHPVARAAEEPCNFFEWSLRCRQTDALERFGGDLLESLE